MEAGTDSETQQIGQDPRTELKDNCIYIRNHHNIYNYPSIVVPVQLCKKSQKIAAKALVDSGATNSLIHQDFVKTHQLPTQPLNPPIKIMNIDGSINQAGLITQQVIIPMILEGKDKRSHLERIILLVTDTGSDNLVLGMNWIQQHNPEIDWKDKTLNMGRCEQSGCVQPLGFSKIQGEKENNIEALELNRGQRRACARMIRAIM